MRLSLIALLSLIFAFEAFAQVRRTRTTRSRGTITHSPRGGRIIVNPGRVDGTRVIINSNGVRVVGPRYNPNRYSTRSIRTVRRISPIIYNSGLYCSYNTLVNNGYTVHSFVFNSDCNQAISDLRATGDFCDGSDLYDGSGRLEASFTFNSECRNALGWYY